MHAYRYEINAVFPALEQRLITTVGSCGASDNPRRSSSAWLWLTFAIVASNLLHYTRSGPSDSVGHDMLGPKNQFSFFATAK